MIKNVLIPNTETIVYESALRNAVTRISLHNIHPTEDESVEVWILEDGVTPSTDNRSYKIRLAPEETIDLEINGKEILQNEDKVFAKGENGNRVNVRLSYLALKGGV